MSRQIEVSKWIVVAAAFIMASADGMFVQEGAVLSPEHRNANVLLFAEPKFGPPEYVYYYTSKNTNKKMCKAFCRDISDTYEQAIQMEESKKLKIDVSLAKQQLAKYVETLKSLGIDVIEVGVDNNCPDGCFIEDPAIVVSPECIITTCPGAESRRPEVPQALRINKKNVITNTTSRSNVAGVRRALDRNGIQRIHAMGIQEGKGTCTIDGGDVMRVGRTFYVGQSNRSTEEGLKWLTEKLALEGCNVVPVQVKDGLHLKSAVVVLDEKRLLVEPGKLDTTPFLKAGLELIPVDEHAGANVLAFGKNIIMSTAAPETIEKVKSLGDFNVIELDMSEIHKADGALTCCSLRVPHVGQWCI